MYIKSTNGSIDQYPYTVAQLRRDNPNTSFPKRIPEATLASWNVYPVINNDAPSYTDRTQKLQRDAAPVLANGSWSIGWIVVDKTADEIAEYDSGIAKNNRVIRNRLLAESDWTQMNDSPLTDEVKGSWAAYRTALRDLTTHENWPNLEDADWPAKP